MFYYAYLRANIKFKYGNKEPELEGFSGKKWHAIEIKNKFRFCVRGFKPRNQENPENGILFSTAIGKLYFYVIYSTRAFALITTLYCCG